MAEDREGVTEIISFREIRTWADAARPPHPRQLVAIAFADKDGNFSDVFLDAYRGPTGKDKDGNPVESGSPSEIHELYGGLLYSLDSTRFKFLGPVVLSKWDGQTYRMPGVSSGGNPPWEE